MSLFEWESWRNSCSFCVFLVVCNCPINHVGHISGWYVFVAVVMVLICDTSLGYRFVEINLWCIVFLLKQTHYRCNISLWERHGTGSWSACWSQPVMAAVFFSAWCYRIVLVSLVAWGRAYWCLLRQSGGSRICRLHSLPCCPWVVFLTCSVVVPLSVDHLWERGKDIE